MNGCNCSAPSMIHSTPSTSCTCRRDTRLPRPSIPREVEVSHCRGWLATRQHRSDGFVSALALTDLSLGRGASPFLGLPCGYPAGMEPIHVGLMADPAAPTEVAKRMSDLA